jgi:hypothetical protein
MSYQSTFDGLAWYERGLLSLFYLTSVFGAVSFVAFDVILLSRALDFKDLESLLASAFVITLQLIWGFVFYSVHQRESISKAAAVALLPMLFTSLPLGLVAYFELTKEPPTPVAPVY